MQKLTVKITLLHKTSMVYLMNLSRKNNAEKQSQSIVCVAITKLSLTTQLKLYPLDYL